MSILDFDFAAENSMHKDNNNFDMKKKGKKYQPSSIEHRKKRQKYSAQLPLPSLSSSPMLDGQTGHLIFNYTFYLS